MVAAREGRFPGLGFSIPGPGTYQEPAFSPGVNSTSPHRDVLLLTYLLTYWSHAWRTE